MIPFFRKLRKQMADNNKPIQYVRYAIGEIFLVVIGILIALQINNWNEDRKHTLKINNLLSEIQDDLLADIIKLDEILIDFKWRDSIINLALKDQLTKEAYVKVPELRYVLYGYEDISLHSNGYENLMNYIDHVPEDYKPLIDQLKFLYTEKTTLLKRLNDRLINDAIESLKGNVDSKEMVYRIMSGELDEEMLNYFLNSKSYKHDLQYRQINLKNFKYLEYRNLASNLYHDIATMIDSPKELPEQIHQSVHKPDELKPFIGSYIMDLDATVTWEISQENTQLILDLGAKNNLEFYQVAPDTFYYISSSNTSIIFRRDSKNEINGCTIHFYDVSYSFHKSGSSLDTIK